MQYSIVGTTGISVSELCMGTMTFGGDADSTESQKMFNLCRDEGVNFFDCANKYGDGKAEVILGECIKDCRDEVVLITKGASRVGSDPNQLGASRKHLMRELEKSLQRLSTDYIDFYFIHYFDPATSMETTLRFLDEAVKQGKILHYGFSNWSAWQMMKAVHICRSNGLTPPDCIQPMYSLVKRQAEVEILPMALDQKLGVVSYSPIGAGVLTGKYQDSEKEVVGRLHQKRYYQQRYDNQIYFDTAKRFVTLAQELGHDPAPLAIRWVMAHPAVTAPIIGARNVEQLRSSLQAVSIPMTDELYHRVAALSPSPAPANDRLEEQLDQANVLR